MLQEAKAFIEKWLQAEVDARNASVKPDVAEANRAVAAMHAVCLPELGEPFGVTTRTFPMPPGFYAQHGHLHFAQTTRKLFKMSAYRHAQYETVFAVYLSQWTNKPDSPMTATSIACSWGASMAPCASRGTIG